MDDTPSHPVPLQSSSPGTALTNSVLPLSPPHFGVPSSSGTSTPGTLLPAPVILSDPEFFSQGTPQQVHAKPERGPVNTLDRADKERNTKKDEGKAESPPSLVLINNGDRLKSPPPDFNEQYMAATPSQSSRSTQPTSDVATPSQLMAGLHLGTPQVGFTTSPFTTPGPLSPPWTPAIADIEQLGTNTPSKNPSHLDSRNA